MRTAKLAPRQRSRAQPLWLLYPVFCAAVYLSHLTLLRLPYFWDEGGYYIPAAWDFFRTGTLIPVTTASNAHPPLPSVLLAAWWHLWGFSPIATHTLVCFVAAAALLAVFQIAHSLLDTQAAIATTVLTGIYPVWFAQSSLAHADIFAAAFTLWGLSFYLESANGAGADVGRNPGSRIVVAALFSLSALCKETAIVTPFALALWHGFQYARGPRVRTHLVWMAALLAPALPLVAWYAYHRHRTGFIFGNPEYLRYNATANLNAYRIAISLYHRLLHLTMHMNMFVPVVCAIAALLMPAIASRVRLERPVVASIAVVLIANWVAFAVLGGALLTRYLLPVYPLILLVCVAEWKRHLRGWMGLALLSAAAFLAGLWVDPPYAFAPEDNLTYRDMVVLHQRAIDLIARKWPQATVLTAWPAVSELDRPEIGYTTFPIKTVAIQNFTLEQIERASNDPGAYDTALLFSTKWAPPQGNVDLGRRNRLTDTRYFDFHEDVRPSVAASILHGEVVWQAHIRGEWVAVLRFPRVEDARLTPLTRSSPPPR